MKKMNLKLTLVVMSVGVIFSTFISCGKSNDEPTSKNLSFTANGVTFEMIFVEKGSFTMGCTPEQGDGNADEKPPHPVTLTEDYYMGKYEVTQKLWHAVTGNSINYQRSLASASSLNGEGDNFPMYYINYDECVAFCTALNGLLGGQLPAGYTFNLPTEAQWEYAARGGKKSVGYKYSGSHDVNTIAWYGNGDESLSTHPVGTKLQNELGIYDMSGNVWERCRDWYSNTYYSTISSGAINPTGPPTGTTCVLRGGCWYNFEKGVRVSQRINVYPITRYDGTGLRLALVKN